MNGPMNVKIVSLLLLADALKITEVNRGESSELRGLYGIFQYHFKCCYTELSNVTCI